MSTWKAAGNPRKFEEESIVTTLRREADLALLAINALLPKDFVCKDCDSEVGVQCELCALCACAGDLARRYKLDHPDPQTIPEGVLDLKGAVIVSHTINSILVDMPKGRGRRRYFFPGEPKEKTDEK
jgi:hypothetical protein